ncbi:MAG: adenylate/guanylate cyclase domain-containing protein [Desulfobacterales bacterium]|nr:adenylate/guanylate cyclase domain-containing protein [Desulfobacterales bacterium]
MTLKSRQIASLASFGLFISILIGISIIGLRNTGKLRLIELSIYDYYLQFQSRINIKDPRILMVAVSEADIRNQGRWPFSDATLASLLQTLLDHEPRVIGLDIYRDMPVPPGTGELTAVFSDNYNIITVTKLGAGKSQGVPQPFMVTDTRLVGFNDLLVDPEGIVRRGLLFLDRDDNRTYYSFSLLMSLLYLESEDIIPEPDPATPGYMKLGKTTFTPLEPNDGGYVGADARGYQFLLDFSGVRAGFSSISMTDALSGRFAPEQVRDRIVIIGSFADSLKDYFFIPFSMPGESGQKIFGAEIHASAVSQLICASEGTEPMSFISDGYEWAWIMVWSVAGLFSGMCIRSLWKFVLANICGLAALTAVTFAVFQNGVWIPVAPPALAGLISAALMTAYLSATEKAHKVLLMQLFSSHVSPAVAQAIWNQRDQLMEDGRPRPQNLTATVLFTDMKGFTTVSERMKAGELMEWLNEYMDAMVKVVRDHGGIVNKFIGDAVMAVFGVPIARTDENGIRQDAVNAVNCAVAMGKKLEELNEIWGSQNQPVTKMRAGIYTGPLMVGSIGSMRRQEYTVIGDTVNIASRLESFDKDLDPDSMCRILIGESTWQYLGQEFETRRLPNVSLKGREQTITIYQVLTQ